MSGGEGLTPSLRRLLGPASYLFIKHPAKMAFDFGWPLLLATSTVAIFSIPPVRPRVLGELGMLKGLREFIGLLVAFFVVALAAVSTVERKALDAPMLGMPPILAGKSLTRRRFRCMLFGYLAMVAFGLFFGAIIGDAIWPSMIAVLKPQSLMIARFILGSCYAIVFWNMVCTTMLEIWFLIERVAQDMPDQASAVIVDELSVKPRWIPEQEPADRG